MNVERSQHIPVMLDEVLKFLQPRPGRHYIDGTIGGGGHSAALLERTAPDGKVLGIDADVQALARVKARLAEFVENGRLLLVHGHFDDLVSIVDDRGFDSVQGILLDLGFSSDQVDDPQRGFSFSADGPLDMRLDQSLVETAADLVNRASEEELAGIFRDYGEERRARQIARRIVHARSREAITRTSQLASLVARGVPYKPGAIHPATRVFQALRIAVNQELQQLTRALPQMVDVLQARSRSIIRDEEVAGRMVVISFHSLEDRIVKAFMRREATDCLCPPRTPVCICGHKARLRLLTAKPVMPSEQEVERNPRARSARLRVAEIIVGS